MARDLSEPLREFVVEAMAAAAPVAALAGPRVYGPAPPTSPEWPFVMADLPTVTPESMGSCTDGTRYTFNVHGYAKGDDERPGARLGAAIAAALDELHGIVVVDPEAVLNDTVWTSTQVFRDVDEADGWHAVVRVYCIVAG